MPLKQVAAGDGKAGDEDPKVDIIAVHGLNPWGNPEHALDTWRKPKGENGNLWLRDELPKTVPHARIFLYSYDSSPAFGSSKERFVHQANDLLERIHIKRSECEKRPIILIGHSLGGILIKQALVNAHSNRRYTPIKQATSGLVFFGTPHAGGKDALVLIGKLSARVASSILQNPSKDVMEALTKGSLFSDVLQESWRHQLNLYKIVSFYEGIGDIVPRESAVLGLSGDVENQVRLEGDHSNICCFDLSMEDEMDNYEVVAANIKELYKASLKRKDAPVSTPTADIEAFTAALKTQGGGDAMNLMASYLTPNPQDYENPDLDYATAVSRDCKRTALHLHVVKDQIGFLSKSPSFNTPGQPVNNVNSNGDNPFHTAATLGRNCATFFLKQKILINAKNNQGNTVLHLYVLASMSPAEKLPTISLLLQHRADTNIENRDGFTPLQLAVKGGQIDVIRLLLDSGVSLVPAPSKTSVLHMSCMRGDVEATKVLLGKGADVSWTDGQGLTVLETISQRLEKGGDDMGRYREIWALLKKYGGGEVVRDHDGPSPRINDVQAAGGAGNGSAAGPNVRPDGRLPDSGHGGAPNSSTSPVQSTTSGNRKPVGGHDANPRHGGAPFSPTPPGSFNASSNPMPAGGYNVNPAHGGVSYSPNATGYPTPNSQQMPAGGYNSNPAHDGSPYSPPIPGYPLPSGQQMSAGGYGASQGQGGALPFPPTAPGYAPASSIPPSGPSDGRPEAGRNKSFQNYMSGGQGAEDLRSMTQKFSGLSSPLKGWGRKKT